MIKMTKLGQTVKSIHTVDDADRKYIGKGAIAPISRFLVAVFFILAVISFNKYDLAGLAGMVIYILIQCIWYELSVREMVKRILPVLFLAIVLGIANPFLDREEYLSIQFIFNKNLTITYGMLSMATLIIKVVFCVMATYILVIHTGIRQICYVLRMLHLPREIVLVLLLMHRYLIVLLKETERMQQAYKLRAPGQKGLHIRAWGSFVGLLLIRSIDRAGEVYESMKLRGFHGEIQVSGCVFDKKASITYVALWGICILAFRIFPVFQIVGSMF